MGRKKRQKSEGELMSEPLNLNILEVENKMYKNCDFCDKSKKHELIVPWNVYTTWLWLMRQFPKLEWGGTYTVLDGAIVDGSFLVPEQAVTGSSMEFLEPSHGNGLIHSHHSLGAFHSGQDDKQARNQYDYSIVLAHSEYEASKRIKLPCGGFAYVGVELLLDNMPEGLEGTADKIREKTFIPTPVALPIMSPIAETTYEKWKKQFEEEDVILWPPISEKYIVRGKLVYDDVGRIPLACTDCKAAGYTECNKCPYMLKQMKEEEGDIYERGYYY